MLNVSEVFQKSTKNKLASQQAQVHEISQIGKWNQGSQASDQAQANPIASRPWGRSSNIEALFRSKDCSPFASQFPFLSPLQKRLNLIRTHWCVDNEGVTRSWERPSNSPHRGSGVLGGVWMSIPAPWCMHSCELVTAFTQIRGQTQTLFVLQYIGKHCRTCNHFIGAARAHFCIQGGPGHIVR